jgi:hypothetical protein
VVVVILVVTLVFAAAVLALVRDATVLRRAVARLEARIAALELEGAATLVIEPEPNATPPPPNPLVN